MSYFCKCPRCGDRTLERLNSYSHCLECLYFEDYWVCREADVNDAKAALEKANAEIEKSRTTVATISVLNPAIKTKIKNAKGA